MLTTTLRGWAVFCSMSSKRRFCSRLFFSASIKISAAEGGGGSSSSFRFRTRSRFRRTALRVPPDILCDKDQQSEQVVRWNQRQEGHDEDGKDYNAKAMIQRNT